MIQKEKNTHRLNFFSKLVLIGIIGLSSCIGEKNDKKVGTIYTGIKVNKAIYEYSQESSLEINETYYSLRQEATYDENGELEKVISYKPEGNLEYTREDLLNDPKLIKNWGFPLHQKYVVEKGELFLNKTKAQRINDAFFKVENRNHLLIYKIK